MYTLSEPIMTRQDLLSHVRKAILPTCLWKHCFLIEKCYRSKDHKLGYENICSISKNQRSRIKKGG